MPKQALKAHEREEAITFLREKLKLEPGKTIYCALAHVSRSGMQRCIKFLLVVDGAVWNISPWVARVLDDRYDDRRGGVVVNGCGMDMGFHEVYNLSRVMFTPKGSKSSAGKDPGYALSSQWV